MGTGIDDEEERRTATDELDDEDEDDDGEDELELLLINWLLFTWVGSSSSSLEWDELAGAVALETADDDNEGADDAAGEDDADELTDDEIEVGIGGDDEIGADRADAEVRERDEWPEGVGEEEEERVERDMLKQKQIIGGEQMNRRRKNNKVGVTHEIRTGRRSWVINDAAEERWWKILIQNNNNSRRQEHEMKIKFSTVTAVAIGNKNYYYYLLLLLVTQMSNISTKSAHDPRYSKHQVKNDTDRNRKWNWTGGWGTREEDDRPN